MSDERQLPMMRLAGLQSTSDLSQQESTCQFDMLSEEVSSLKSEVRSQKLLLAQIAQCLLGEKVTIPAPVTVASQVSKMEATLQEVCCAVATQKQHQELHANALCEGLKLLRKQQAQAKATLPPKSTDIELLSDSVDALHSYVNQQVESLTGDIAQERKARLVREAKEAREGSDSLTMLTLQVEAQREDLKNLRTELAEKFVKQTSSSSVTTDQSLAEGMIRGCSSSMERAVSGGSDCTLQQEMTQDAEDELMQSSQTVAQEDLHCGQAVNKKASVANIVQKLLDRTEALEQNGEKLLDRTGALEQNLTVVKKEWEERAAEDKQHVSQDIAQAAAVECGSKVQNLIMQNHHIIHSCFSERLSEMEEKLQQQAEFMTRLDAVEARLNEEIKNQLEQALHTFFESDRQVWQVPCEQAKGLPALPSTSEPPGRTQWVTKLLRPSPHMFGSKAPRGRAKSRDICDVDSFSRAAHKNLFNASSSQQDLEIVYI